MSDPTMLLALCAIAGPIAAAHPEWTTGQVADAAHELVEACACRLWHERVTPRTAVVVSGEPGPNFPEELSGMLRAALSGGT
jgi:hypothetical protein